MATLTPITADPLALTTSAQTLLTADAQTLNVRVKVANTTAATLKFTGHAVPSGGTVAAGNAFAFATSIAANEARDFDVGNLEAGASVQGLADAAGLNLFLLNAIERE